MACFPELTKQLSPSCDTLIKSGWTGRARLWQYSRTTVILGINGAHPASITNVSPIADNEVRVYNIPLINPFTGTSVAGNADSGKVAFTKTISLLIPKQNIAITAESRVDPLALDAVGYLVMLERKDGQWIVFGAYDPCTADLSSFSQNEYENGGNYVLNLTCTEQVAEVYYNGPTEQWIK